MLFVFDAMVFYLPPKMGDDFQKAVEEINRCGFSMGRKVFVFDTQEAAQSFADRIAKLEGIDFKVSPVPSYPNSDDYSLGKGKYAISFVGVKKTSKTVDVPSDFFQASEETGKDYSRDSRMKTEYAGDLLMTQEEEKRSAEDKDFALTGKDEFVSQKTKDVMQTTVANLFLAYRNVPTNKGSTEELEYSVRITLTQLATKMGFSGESAIIDFLKTEQGKTFRDELEQAALDGKFFIGGSASSEWMSNQWSFKTVSKTGRVKWRGIKYELEDNALGRCQMALDFINDWLHDAGREALSAPFVPTVYLIVEPTESVRSKLVEIGVENFSQRCTNKEAIANVRKYLDDYYSSERIAENCNRFGNYIYDLMQRGDSDATDTWDKLTSGKSPAMTYTVKEDEAGKTTVDCQISNQGKADNLFSMSVRGKGSMLEQALSQGDSRSAAFSLQENTTLGIEIVGKESQKFEPGKEGAIKLSVVQQYTDRNSEPHQVPFSGTVIAKVYDEAGNEVACRVPEEQNEDGTYNAIFTPEAGKKYSFIAYAFNSDERGKITIDSGRVKQTVKVEEEEKVSIKINKTTETKKQKEGRTKDLTFSVYEEVTKGKTTTTRPRDAVLLFGVRTSESDLGYAPKFVSIPETDMDIAGKEWAYSYGGQEVILDRDLVFEGTTYPKDDKLVEWAKSGYIGVKLTGKDGKEYWYSFDGRVQFNDNDLASLEHVDDKKWKMTFLKDPAKTLNKTKVAQRFDPEEVPNTVEPSMNKTAFLPNAFSIGKKFTLYGKEYDPKELLDENIAAFLVKVSGKDEAEVYDRNGKKLATIDIGVDPKKTKKENEAKIDGQLMALQDNGLFYFQKNDEGSFTISTYVPHVSLFGEVLAQVEGYLIAAKSKDIISTAGKK